MHIPKVSILESNLTRLPLPIYADAETTGLANCCQSILDNANCSYSRYFRSFRISSYGDSLEELNDAIYGNNLEVSNQCSKLHVESERFCCFIADSCWDSLSNLDIISELVKYLGSTNDYSYATEDTFTYCLNDIIKSRISFRRLLSLIRYEFDEVSLDDKDYSDLNHHYSLYQYDSLELLISLQNGGQEVSQLIIRTEDIYNLLDTISTLSAEVP